MMITVVSPLHNEAENVTQLIEEIAQACAGLPAFEVVLVDDGSSDDTGRLIAEALRYSWLRRIYHPKAGGQSAAVQRVGGGRDRRTLDGDLQTHLRKSRTLWHRFWQTLHRKLWGWWRVNGSGGRIRYQNAGRRGLPIRCGPGCWTMIRATRAAGSRHFGVMRFWSCLISTTCIGICPRCSNGTGGRLPMLMSATANVAAGSPNTTTCSVDRHSRPDRVAWLLKAQTARAQEPVPAAGTKADG